MAPAEQEHHGVDATVVGVDPGVEPIRSIVVGDKRDTLGKRLGLLALIILVLFFAISSYIQSSRNGAQLTRAAKDRSNLIHTLNAQSDLIRALQQAIAAQNEELQKHGLKTVKIPVSKVHDPRFLPSPSPQTQPTPQSSSHPRPKPRPSPRPSPSPSPKPTEPVRDKICELTGVCLNLHLLSLRFTF